MPQILERHDELIVGLVEAHGGTIFRTMGDALCAAFASPSAALAAAGASQQARRGDSHSAAQSLGVIGALALYRGDVTEAHRLATQAVEMLSRSGDNWSAVIARVLLGYLELDLGHIEKAQALFVECVPMSLRLANFYLASLLDGLVGVAAVRGEWDVAGQLYGAGLAIRAVHDSREPLTFPYPRDAVVAVQEALGEERFAAAAARGAGRSVEDLVAEMSASEGG